MRTNRTTRHDAPNEGAFVRLLHYIMHKQTSQYPKLASQFLYSIRTTPLSLAFNAGAVVAFVLYRCSCYSLLMPQRHQLYPRRRSRTKKKKLLCVVCVYPKNILHSRRPQCQAERPYVLRTMTSEARRGMSHNIPPENNVQRRPIFQCPPTPHRFFISRIIRQKNTVAQEYALPGIQTEQCGGEKVHHF